MSTRLPQLVAAATFFLCLLASSFIAAHEVRPAFLEIKEVGPTSYDVLWKRPTRDQAVIRLTPVFPGDCRDIARHHLLSDGALVSRASLKCEKSLSGRTLHIEGLSATMVDVLVRVRLQSGDEQSVLLRGGNDSLEVARAPSSREVLSAYMGLGVEHILAGFDHLLFVFGLLLLIGGWRSLLIAITSFTLAHSVTLGLSALEIIVVPGAPVEAVIALSIVLLAVEVIKKGERPSLTERRPWLIAFAVGLLHGLGFAGALREIGLPTSEIPLALFSFNLGVEIGQLSFVLAVLLLLGAIRRFDWSRGPWLRRWAAYAIGSMGAFWTLERTAAFL